MAGGRLSAWLLIVWTLTMALWLVLYREADVTCGPEIYRNCQIGVKVNTGLGRPGIVLLWSLGAGALGIAWLTTRRLSPKPVRHAEPPPESAFRTLPAMLRGAAKMSAFVFPLAVVAGFVAAPSPRAPSPGEGVRVQVLSAILHPAGNPARRRSAARVSVHVRVTNASSDRFTFDQPLLLSAGEALAYDTAQYALRPLQPRATVDATLRFEPRSNFSERLLTSRRAQLDFADHLASLTLTIGRPVLRAQVRILSASLHPATTRAGRRRHAARVSVHVRVTNLGSRRVTLPEALLLSGGSAIEPDRDQPASAAPLRRPVAPGATADGTLRFKATGAFTDRLARRRRAQLRIGGRSVSLTLEVGRR